MYKVVLVDDEQLIIKGLANMGLWDELGLKVVGQFNDGTDALNYIRFNDVDILITDIRMPELSGLELVRAVNMEKPEVMSLILSGFDDFDYIKEGITLGIENYLLKPVSKDELYVTLNASILKLENERRKQLEYRKSLDILLTNTLNQWINSDVSKSEFDERVALFGIEMHFHEIYVAVISPQYKKKEIVSEDLILCIKHCDLENNQINTMCFFDYHNNIVVLFFIKEPVSEQLATEVINNTLCEAAGNIYNVYGFESFMTVGCCAREFDDVASSYRDAINLQAYQFLLPFNNVVFQHDLIDKSSKLQALKVDYQKLKQIIKNCDREAADRFIENQYNPSVLLSIENEVIHEFTIDILYRLKHIVSDILPADDSFYTVLRNMLFQVHSLKTINLLNEHMKGLLNITIDHVLLKKKSINPLIKRVLVIIDKNYAHNMNIKTLAVDMNVTPSYLGYLFTKETGYVFTDYLNRTRVDKAKEFLEKTNYSMEKIAGLLGYNNRTYFLSIFKKFEGVTPTEYKISFSNNVNNLI